MILRLIYVVAFLLTIYLGYEMWGVNHAKNIIEQVPGVQERVNPKKQKVIIEFFDYRCPHCRNSHKYLKEYQQQNPDVTIIYQPLPVFGKESVEDARFALAAGQQGRFHDVHDYLMARTQPVGLSDVKEIALELDMDILKLKDDLHSDVVTKHMLGIMDAVAILNVQATPTFLIGDMRYVGSVSGVAQLEELVMQAYGAKK